MLKSSKEVQDLFQDLGTDWELSEELFSKLNEFTCQLYGSKSPNMQVNDFRYHLFCSKKGEVESHQLPPCQDSFHKHAQRANYQTAIWRRSLEKEADIPSPVGFGWKLETVDDLVIDWMDGTPAPDTVLQFLACKCTKSCQAPSCPCVNNQMKCSDMCRLKTCGNQENTDSDSFSLVPTAELNQDDEDEY